MTDTWNDARQFVPDNSRPVLVFLSGDVGLLDHEGRAGRGHGFRFGWFDSDDPASKWYGWWVEGSKLPDGSVTHWRDLPEAPTEASRAHQFHGGSMATPEIWKDMEQRWAEEPQDPRLAFTPEERMQARRSHLHGPDPVEDLKLTSFALSHGWLCAPVAFDSGDFCWQWTSPQGEEFFAEVPWHGGRPQRRSALPELNDDLRIRLRSEYDRLVRKILYL